MKYFDQHLTYDRKIIVKMRFKNLKILQNKEQIIQNYKISNFWKGRFFLKRLINKIFKYRLYKPLKWEKNFWNIITIKSGESEIQLSENLKDMVSLDLIIKKNTRKERYKDIKKYQEIINTGINMGPLLYITGKCLNYLGAKTDENDIFILDGSRRLIANVLNKKNPEILLLDLNNE
tara:strand:- start:88 stop:618 length:531 start_codon:yes stop_codon:yes gene_type:complete